MSLCPFVRLSVCPFVCLSVCLFVSTTVTDFISIAILKFAFTANFLLFGFHEDFAVLSNATVRIISYTALSLSFAVFHTFSLQGKYFARSIEIEGGSFQLYAFSVMCWGIM